MLPPAQKATILGGGPQPTNLTIKKVASQDRIREQKDQRKEQRAPSQDELKQKTVSLCEAASAESG